MGRQRVRAPQNAAQIIEELATKGRSIIGIAKHLGTSVRTMKRWIEEDETLEEAFETGRDAHRQHLEEQIVALTLANKNPSGLIYLCKAKYKMFDQPSSASKVDVGIGVAVQAQPVMVIRDHGDDESWATKAAAQQAALLADAGRAPTVIERSPALPSQAMSEPAASPLPIQALQQPVAPSWKGNS